MYITEDKLVRKQNNFDLLRLLAALFVFISHTYAITSTGTKDLLYQLSGGRYLFSTAGLIIFFSMSGFLVCRSLLTSSSLKQYFLKRFLRIWPAYFVCILFCIFFIGTLFTTLPVTGFFVHPDTVRFFIKNSTLLSSHLVLPGVFNNSSVNASAWTIPVEVRLYILLGLLFLFTKSNFRRWAPVILLIGWLLQIIIPLSVQYQYLKPHLVSAVYLGLYFLAGVCFYQYKNKLPLKFQVWVLLFCLWFISLRWFPQTLSITELPFFLYSLFWVSVGWKKIPFWRADISYGFYLFSYPIQKAIHTTMGQYLNFIEFFVLTGVSTTCLALLSWYFIEKKALKYKTTALNRLSLAGAYFSKKPEDKANSYKQDSQD